MPIARHAICPRLPQVSLNAARCGSNNSVKLLRTARRKWPPRSADHRKTSSEDGNAEDREPGRAEAIHSRLRLHHNQHQVTERSAANAINEDFRIETIIRTLRDVLPATIS